MNYGKQLSSKLIIIQQNIVHCILRLSEGGQKARNTE